MKDPTGAVIPGAQVQASDNQKAVTDGTGHYLLPCVPMQANTLRDRPKDSHRQGKDQQATKGCCPR